MFFDSILLAKIVLLKASKLKSCCSLDHIWWHSEKLKKKIPLCSVLVIAFPKLSEVEQKNLHLYLIFHIEELSNGFTTCAKATMKNENEKIVPVWRKKLNQKTKKKLLDLHSNSFSASKKTNISRKIGNYYRRPVWNESQKNSCKNSVLMWSFSNSPYLSLNSNMCFIFFVCSNWPYNL